MDKPIISIILPTYNRAKVLSRCIDSVLAQSFRNWELIISDDGSSDDTSLIATEYSEKDSRIHYLRNSNRQGLPKNRNIGFSISKGDLIFFIEDDLVLEPNCVETLVGTFGEQEAIGNKVGAIAPRVVQKHEEIRGPFDYATHKKLKKSNQVCIFNEKTGFVYDDFGIESSEIQECPTLHACSMMPRASFEKVQGFEENRYKGSHFREETDFYFRIRALGYGLYFQPRAVAYHEKITFGGCRTSSTISGYYYIIRNHIVFLHRIFGMKVLYMGPSFLLHSIYMTFQYIFQVAFPRSVKSLFV